MSACSQSISLIDRFGPFLSILSMICRFWRFQMITYIHMYNLAGLHRSVNSRQSWSILARFVVYQAFFGRFSQFWSILASFVLLCLHWSIFVNYMVIFATFRIVVSIVIAFDWFWPVCLSLSISFNFGRFRLFWAIFVSVHNINLSILVHNWSILVDFWSN